MQLNKYERAKNYLNEYDAYYIDKDEDQKREYLKLLKDPEVRNVQKVIELLSSPDLKTAFNKQIDSARINLTTVTSSNEKDNEHKRRSLKHLEYLKTLIDPALELYENIKKEMEDEITRQGGTRRKNKCTKKASIRKHKTSRRSRRYSKRRRSTKK